jgi:hypothetical protein
MSKPKIIKQALLRGDNRAVVYNEAGFTALLPINTNKAYKLTTSIKEKI